MARYISGIILAVCVVALLGWAPASVCALVVLGVTALASLEFAGLCVKEVSRAEKIVGAFFSVLIVFVTYGAALMMSLQGGGPQSGWDLAVNGIFEGLNLLTRHRTFSSDLFLFLLMAFFSFFVAGLLKNRELPDMFGRVVSLSFGVMYVALPLSCLVAIVMYPSRAMIFWLLAATFLGDTGAYFFGRLFGGKKMAPRISPAKTWSGFCGALFGGFVGVVIVEVFALRLTFGEWQFSNWHFLTGLLGSGVAVFGVLGDLFESLLKRALGVKDSGTLIPGHGGILDRIDALLFTAPVVYILLSAGVFHWP